MQPTDNQNPKGRNSHLITRRNERLAARFYWYSTLLGLKFSRCLEHLAEEFDLSEARLIDLIADNADLIGKYERESTTLAELKLRYPFLSWIYPPAKKSHNGVQLSLGLF